MRKTLIVSNTSVARTVDINWTGAGEKTTLCQSADTVDLMHNSTVVSTQQ